MRLPFSENITGEGFKTLARRKLAAGDPAELLKPIRAENGEARAGGAVGGGHGWRSAGPRSRQGRVKGPALLSDAERSEAA